MFVFLKIFGEIVDGTMAIDAQSKPMIEDAFAIISCQVEISYKPFMSV